MIKEFKTYFWGNGDTPIKKDDHALDELRYYIMSKPVASLPFKKQKSSVQKQKEKLIKKLKHNYK